MLSYRHAFHAGNHADVLKHSVLMLVLEYIIQKDKPFLYVDTHAGAGCYDLRSGWARKNCEYAEGVERVWPLLDAADCPSGLQAYLSALKKLNPHGELHEYPGSPWLAQSILRTQDKARLFELHPNEYKNLQTLFAHDKQIRVEQTDGFQALNALLPPAERRAVVLIDPPYEVKTDYQTLIESLKIAYKKFSTGVYLIWYPVLDRKVVNRLERNLIDSGIRNVLLAELCIREDVEDVGMTGSGMIIINPPWQLNAVLKDLMPQLVRMLSASGSFRLQQLVTE